MEAIKKFTVIIATLILVSLAGVVVKILLTEGFLNYIKHLRYFGMGYSDRLDFFLCFVIACFILLIQRPVKLLLGKNSSDFVQGISGSILSVLSFCLFAGFVVGFRIAFQFHQERLTSLSPIFIMGFLLPFSARWISTLLNKV